MPKPKKLTPENMLPEFAYPSATKATVLGEHIFFVTIGHDDDCENPLTSCDGMGKIMSMGRRHVSRAQAEQAAEELNTNPDAVPLSYFEHGNCVWSVSGDKPAGTEGDWRWDGVDLAGVWVPDQCCVDSYDPAKDGDRKAWMKKQAESACAEYTLWCNGECYYYSVAVYDYRKPYDQKSDYRFDKAVYEDSCSGFIGWDMVVADAIATVNLVIELYTDEGTGIIAL